MKIRLSLALLAAGLAAAVTAPTASAQEHDHDSLRRCNWQSDLVPRFLNGDVAHIDVGRSVRKSGVFGAVVGVTRWRVLVFPGYHFGYVFAMDEGVPRDSSVTKAAARSSIYCVRKVRDCCLPTRFTKSTIVCGFDLAARQLNDPGYAYAEAATVIQALNTGAVCAAAGAASTDRSESNKNVTLEVNGQGDVKVRVSFSVDFDTEEETLDAVSKSGGSGMMPAHDEEYLIDTDLDLKAQADGAPWDTGAAAALISNHRMTLTTAVQCNHCTAKNTFIRRVRGNTWGVDETTR